VVAVDRTRGANPDEVAAELRRLPGVANVSAPVVDAAGDAAVLIVEPAGAPSDEATAALVDRVRAAVPAGVYVTGGAATFADIANRLADRLWVVIGFVVALSVVLLTLLLRAPVVVFVGFALDPDVTVKTLGIGMAVAVLIDATIVRMVLVPATMALIGRMNWWVPRWLDRLLPHVEGSSPVPAPPERELIKV
jgi:RND superfamily putative drug exporter